MEKFKSFLDDDYINEVLGSFDEKELEKAGSDRILSAISKIPDKLSMNVLKDIKKRKYVLVKENKRQRNNFESKLYKHWKKPLDLLEMFITISIETGSEFNEYYRKKAIEENDIVFEALTRLHGRSCLIANETLSLLKSGYASGANSRWRSLHEVSIIANLLSENDNDLSERYLLHENIESYKSITEFQKHANKLNHKPYSVEEVTRAKAIFGELCNRYGTDYKESYGWASKLLNKKSLTIKDIERYVNLEHWRPYYRMSSHSIHANPKGIMFDLGVENSSNLILAGPSVYGLADPGHSCSISLSQVNISLLNLRPTTSSIAIMKLFLSLVDEIGTEFLRCHDELKEKV